MINGTGFKMRLFVSKVPAFLLSGLVAISFLAGCSTIDSKAPPAKSVSPAKLHSDLRTIEALRPQIVTLDEELHKFRQGGGWQARGFFDAEETREIETLLFRFTTYHTALWDMVQSYGGPEADFTGSDNERKAHLLSAFTMLLLANHTAYLVTEFANDPIAIKQINQAYYRSGILFGTHDTARINVTGSDKRQAVVNDKRLYASAKADPDSYLSQLAESDPAFAALIEELPALMDQVDERLAQVAKIYGSNLAAKLDAELDKESQHKILYSIRSVTFKDVSRLKSPDAHLVQFTDAQKQQVYDLLEPGDLILTYTAGYMSSVFIPGAFKHGITYIGTPEQRQALALSPDDLSVDQVYQPELLISNLENMRLDDGKQADMIEAVAEGVIFNNVSHIMDTHINRMLVLRPRLSEVERRSFLVEIFSYLGNGYDFRFDFSDATYQVCTEVIYRGIDGKGHIEFSLTERAGHATLSADDVALYYLNATPPAFDFVLYAEEDPMSDNYQARVLVGNEGSERVAALMEEQKE